MPRSPECRECHEILPKASPGGLCPRCLMGGILADFRQPDGAAGSLADASSSPATATGGIGLLADPMEGVQIGRYKILQRIGEGGFGMVYMAEQVESVHRRVALKIIKAGMDSRQVIARFEAERQALAMMDHPNIARVLDVGETSEGRPYFVMELVKGIPITTYCLEEKLSTELRLKLFMQVCTAVQHAHMKGIIHRDLKPSNILITLHDGDPVPKVIDFGIAKAMDQRLTDKTLFTRYDHMVGTPAYMSPEQAALSGLDVDTRSDVYALGVLLYELLTGTTPFDAETLREAAFDEMRRMIREDEPPKPSTRLTNLWAQRETTKAAHPISHDRPIPQDLDWIAMKALEKDRGRRYDTAAGLAQDIERFTKSEPVTAGPPGVGYKLRKFVSRNRKVVAGGVFVIGSLIGGITLASWGMARAVDAEKHASDNLGKLERSYQGLSEAQIATEKARRESQQELVRRLLESGTEKYNEGECLALITLQDAVTAARGAPELERKAMGLWTLARSWLPGRVEGVIEDCNTVAMSPDESVVSWWNEHGLHLLTIATGDHQTIPLGDDLTFPQLLFSPDSRQLAAFNPREGILQIWDVTQKQPATGLLRHPDLGLPFNMPRGDGGTGKIAFDPRGVFLATIAYNGTACLWHTTSGTMATESWPMGTADQTDSFTNHLAFSRSGKFLALAKNRLIRIVDLTDGSFASREFVNNLNSDYEDGSVYGLLMPNDSQLVTANIVSASIWSLESEKIVATYEIPFKNTQSQIIEDIALSPDGMTVVLGTRNGDARLCDASTLAQVGILKHGGIGVSEARFLCGGGIVTVGGESVHLWSAGTHPEVLLGNWPQFTSTGSAASGNIGHRIVTHSRGAIEGMNSRALVRSLPTRHDFCAINPVPAEGTLMHITPDGTQLLVRSKDRRSLNLYGADGGLISQGPRVEQYDAWIRRARFTPAKDEIIYQIERDPQDERQYGQDYRRWNILERKHGTFSLSFSEGRYNTSLGCILPTSPLSIVINSDQWKFMVIDLESQKEIAGAALQNQCATSIVSASAGWYGVGDRSGNFRRYRLADHGEIYPKLRFGGTILRSAVSGDGEWLLGLERDSDGVQRMRAFHLVGEAPFFNLQLHFPDQPDSLMFPVGERGFVFQMGQEIHRLDLPQVTETPERVKPLTEAVLAVKRDEKGRAGYRMLTAEEYREAKAVEDAD